MSNIIEKLREKPEHHRRRYAVGISSIAMLLVVGVWVSTFSVRFPQLVRSPDAEAAAIISDSQSPVDSLSNGYNNLAQAFNGIQATSSQTTSSHGVIITNPSQNTAEPTQAPAYNPYIQQDTSNQLQVVQ